MSVADVASPLPELRFRLPGEWWQIPLDSTGRAHQSIRALVARQVGPADDLATLRRQFRDELTTAVDAAIGGGGQSMHVALDIIEQIPFSASFTVFLPDIRMTPAVGTSSSEVLAVVEEGIRQTAPDELAAARRFEAHRSGVLRVQRRGVAHGGDAGEQPALAVDYWMTIPETKRVILIAFSTAFVDLEDVMLELFDSIVRATYWVPATAVD